MPQPPRATSIVVIGCPEGNGLPSGTLYPPRRDGHSKVARVRFGRGRASGGARSEGRAKRFRHLWTRERPLAPPSKAALARRRALARGSQFTVSARRRDPAEGARSARPGVDERRAPPPAAPPIEAPRSAATARNRARARGAGNCRPHPTRAAPPSPGPQPQREASTSSGLSGITRVALGTSGLAGSSRTSTMSVSRIRSMRQLIS